MTSGYNGDMDRIAFPRLVAAGIALVSGTALALAFIAQYGFDLWPCLLCYWQRVPYALTLGLGLLALLPYADPKALRGLAFLCAALFLANAGLAFFHAGVEYKWWPGLASCGGIVRNFDINDLAAALSKPQTGGCEEAALRVFGISMAGGNVIVCGFTAVAVFWAALQKPRWV